MMTEPSERDAQTLVETYLMSGPTLREVAIIMLQALYYIANPQNAEPDLKSALDSLTSPLVTKGPQ